MSGGGGGLGAFLTVVLLQKLRAPLVALLGQLHPGRRRLGAEGLGEVKLSLAVPPALRLGHAAELGVLCRDLCADGELVGDVLHTL